MSKLVALGIIAGVRLPHIIEGVDVQTADQLVDLATKQRLMSLRPSLFRKNDPDWPAKVVSVAIVAEEAEPETKKGKKSAGDHPA